MESHEPVVFLGSLYCHVNVHIISVAIMPSAIHLDVHNITNPPLPPSLSYLQYLILMVYKLPSNINHLELWLLLVPHPVDLLLPHHNRGLPLPHPAQHLLRLRLLHPLVLLTSLFHHLKQHKVHITISAELSQKCLFLFSIF